MDELQSIRSACEFVKAMIEAGTYDGEDAAGILAEQLDTLTHWVIQIATRLDMK